MKRVRQLLSIILSVAIILGLTPAAFADSAAASQQVGTVYVTIEDTIPTPQGESYPAPKGVMVYSSPTPLYSTDTAIDVINRAAVNNGLVVIGADTNYITSIGGVAAGSRGKQSGWMGTLNDWFTANGLNEYKAADATLQNGDELCMMFSLNYGEDLGGTWNNTNKTLKNISINYGSLIPQFSPDNKTYTLAVPASCSSIVLKPTAANKNYQVRTTVGGTVYKRTANIPVEDNTVIHATCGDPSWPSMNNGQYGNGSESIPAQTYTITVVKEKSPVSPTPINNSTSNSSSIATVVTPIVTPTITPTVTPTVTPTPTISPSPTAAPIPLVTNTPTKAPVPTAEKTKKNESKADVVLSVNKKVSGYVLPSVKIIKAMKNTKDKMTEVTVKVANQSALKNITLSKEVLKQAKTSKSDLKISIADKSGKKTFTWNFKAPLIAKAKVISNINLLTAVDRISSVKSKDKTLKAAVGNQQKTGTVIYVYQKGALPVQADLTVYTKNISSKIYIYQLNTATKRLTALTGGYSYKTDNKGRLTFRVKNGGEYAALIKKVTSK